MANQIPIQNLYYLLAYAWDSLAESDEINIAATDCKSLTELFARVLATGTQHLLRHGLDRGYIDHREETSRIRGRFVMSESLSRQSWQRGTMVCEFDDLSHNVIQNRILKTTIDDLLRATGIQGDTRRLLHNHSDLLREIEPVRLTSRLFRRIPLHRNNRHYRFLLNVCELLYDSRLPEQRDGTTRFRDFIRDPKQMPYLFERFVRNFYKREQNAFKVDSIQMQWPAAGNPEDLAVLPIMRTDVSLRSRSRSIILDCKFYREAMSGRVGNEKIHATNLYQLYAYLKIARFRTGWEESEGILLYPAVGREFDHKFTIDGHPVRVTSINLDRPWRSIHDELLGVLLAPD